MKDYLIPKFCIININITDIITISSQSPETNPPATETDDGWSPIWRPIWRP